MPAIIAYVTTALLLVPSLSFAEPVPVVADISVNGVSLFDVESQERVLGEKIPFNNDVPPFGAAFESKDGRQVLTVLRTPTSSVRRFWRITTCQSTMASTHSRTISWWLFNLASSIHSCGLTAASTRTRKKGGAKL
jgi:hypothetical protein